MKEKDMVYTPLARTYSSLLPTSDAYARGDRPLYPNSCCLYPPIADAKRPYAKLRTEIENEI
jgi:hypothetical protein